jgi:hypothetical protein
VIVLFPIQNIPEKGHYSTADLRKITTKHKAKYKKVSDGLLSIKTTCAKLLYF